jgi:Chaperone of endosialidase
MSAPTGVTATVSQSGGPGSYVITYSWSATGATSFTYRLNSIIWGVTQTVVGPTTTPSAGSGTYTNTVTGASYQLVVSASNLNGTSSATSTQVSVYNPYGGPQGVQGYQGVQGDQGATGPTGLQGSRGLQGLMEINNYTVANQITTTAADTAHLNANSGLTWNGATLNIGGNITGVTSINNTTVGGVVLSSGTLSNATAGTTLTITGQTTASTIPTLTVNAPSGSGTGYTISAGGSNLIGGVVLSSGTLSNATAGTTLTITGQTTASTIPTLTVNAPSGSGTGYTISAGGSNLIGGVVLSSGALSSLTTISNTASTSVTINSPSTGAATIPTLIIFAPSGATPGNAINVSNVALASNVFTVSSNGTCTGVDFVATSDRRLKTDISTISNALDTVKAMRGVYFTRLGKTQRTVGVIAQEVEEVLPEVVYTGDDEMKSVSYGNMVGLLIEAVKELSEKMKV